MFTFNVKEWVPRFILADKNGYALAKAIETGLQMMNDIINTGVKCIADYDTMPEWRLDEMAWETNCLYDFNADVETKRKWIKNAIPLYRLFGTPQAIQNYIGSYFESMVLEENWAYGGDPYHFRITVSGEWTPENEAWARKAIATAKNVRSVLDSLRVGSVALLVMAGEGEVYGRFYYPMTGTENWAGRWPQENMIAVMDEGGKTGMAADGTQYIVPYKMTGTSPEINTLACLSDNNIQSAAAEDTYSTVFYKMCGQDDDF